MRRRLVLLACLGALFAVPAAAFLVWSLRVSASRPPDVIRAELLALTPPGTDLADVEASLREQGRAEGMCWREHAAGVKSEVMVQYGAYRTLQTPLWPTTVQAHYHFDRDGRLTAITLRRFPEPYPGQAR